MTSDVIIDHCLKAIGEDDPDNPVEMTRVEVLSFIDSLYRNNIAKRLRLLATHTYDSSDADHTITAGVGTLPSDFLAPSRVYDGDTRNNYPLEQIFNIDGKVSDTDTTSQYFLPNIKQIWIFGQTPTNTIKMYYYKKPPALTDSASSTPEYLKEEFHMHPFTKAVQGVYASRNGDYGDEIDLEIYMQDILNEIEYAHNEGLRDKKPCRVKTRAFR